MRRYIPALLLTLAAIAPFPLTGCDLLPKKGDADAGGDAATAAPPAGDGAVATPADTATAPPLASGTATVTPTGTLTAVQPVAKTDAAVPIVDAAAPKADGGPAPSPTPTLTIPPLPANLFDGGFKFDAGGFKPPWVK